MRRRARQNPLAWDAKVVAELLRDPHPGATAVLTDYLLERGVEGHPKFPYFDSPSRAIADPDWYDLAAHVRETLWIATWADFVEEPENEHLELPRAGGGQDWADFTPEPPDEVFKLSRKYLSRVVREGRGSHLVAILRLATRELLARQELNGGRLDGYLLQQLGHDLALEALGHGIGVADDFKEEVFDPVVPHLEFHIWDLPPKQIEKAIRYAQDAHVGLETWRP